MGILSKYSARQTFYFARPHREELLRCISGTQIVLDVCLCFSDECHTQTARHTVTIRDLTNRCVRRTSSVSALVQIDSDDLGPPDHPRFIPGGWLHAVYTNHSAEMLSSDCLHDYNIVRRESSAR